MNVKRSSVNETASIATQEVPSSDSDAMAQVFFPTRSHPWADRNSTSCKGSVKAVMSATPVLFEAGVVADEPEFAIYDLPQGGSWRCSCVLLARIACRISSCCSGVMYGIVGIWGSTQGCILRRPL